MDINQEELLSFTEYQDKLVKDMVARSEAIITEFNNMDFVEIKHDAFIRVGLPIIHGVLRNEIHPNAWIQFIGGTNQRVEVYKDDETFLAIPPIFATVPTNVFVDAETPTFFSFVGELNLERRQNPELWEMAVTKRLGNSFSDLKPNFKFFVKINELFVKYGLPEIKAEDFVAKEPEGVINTNEPESIEVKHSASTDKNVTVFDEGELL